MNITAFETALNKLDNGWIFEDFSHNFLSARLGYEFIPVGGTGDKGIDGFEHLFRRKSNEKELFQISTENADPQKKIENTIDKLITNGKSISRLTYVSNRKINNKDSIQDSVLDRKNINVRIWDSDWFKTNVNYSNATERVYDSFLKSNYQEYSKPGKSYVLSNLDEDSRLFVFLRQQIEDNNDTKDLNNNLIDSLILYHLEPTNPEKEIVISKKSIIDFVKKFLKKDDASVDESVNERLEIIQKTKGKKIQYHKKLDGYCLPYETRKEITERNLQDLNLEQEFTEQTTKKIKDYLKDEKIIVHNVSELIKEIVRTIFYEQGLEFSNFLINKDSNNCIEKQLIDVVEKVVNASSIKGENKSKVKECLIYAIREIVYNGTIEQKRYLKSLSNTYMLMFLLQWDPKVAIYFQSLANKLTLFIGNSILIPAFSEYFLEDVNKRHWNLLRGARKAGVNLVVSDPIIDELVSHFEILRNSYYSHIQESEDFYLEDEYNLTAIPHIIIRAYFYAKKRGKINSFDKFINHFVTPDLKTAKVDFIQLLKEMFGIEYIPEEELDVKIDSEIQEKLTEELTHSKGGMSKKAEVDAKLILSVYALREKNKETKETSIFGYRTWWLSKDTTTFRIVKKVLTQKYHESCYIRPDFLYNYIALAPKEEEVKEVYDDLFPSLLGVNLSYHLPNDVAENVQKSINDHKELPNYRKQATLRRYTEKLKSDSNLRKKKNLDAFFEQEFKV